ncbi:hypothetical protein ACIP39_14280 [Streptomyces tibetensis]|uniref:hypothetical protein n=1 Tax=Streptomyces tibetensis TaxID=2382123 RepID=UPI00381B7605
MAVRPFPWQVPGLARPAGQEHPALFDRPSFAAAIEQLCSAGAAPPVGRLRP